MATVRERANARVKGLPPGWDVLQHFHIGEHRDAVVLCQRTVEDGDHGTQFVVWWHNAIEGGCYSGKYVDSYTDALAEFNSRRRRLR